MQQILFICQHHKSITFNERKRGIFPVLITNHVIASRKLKSATYDAANDCQMLIS